MPSKIPKATWDQLVDTLNKMGKAQDRVSQRQLKAQVSRSPIKHSSPSGTFIQKKPQTISLLQKRPFKEAQFSGLQVHCKASVDVRPWD